jgi:hypothetical protein
MLYLECTSRKGIYKLFDVSSGTETIWHQDSPRPGRMILAHNHIRHNARTQNGVNGFRAWFTGHPSKDFVVCPCGWRPELGEHYAWKEHVEYHKGRAAAHPAGQRAP